MSAAAILSGVMAGLAARLLTIMIFGFEILIWAPRLAATPYDHFNWAGNAISIAMGAAAWVVSDAINLKAKPVGEIEIAYQIMVRF